jgi:hypothetical protein
MRMRVFITPRMLSMAVKFRPGTRPLCLRLSAAELDAAGNDREWKGGGGEYSGSLILSAVVLAIGFDASAEGTEAGKMLGAGVEVASGGVGNTTIELGGVGVHPSSHVLPIGVKIYSDLLVFPIRHWCTGDSPPNHYSARPPKGSAPHMRPGEGRERQGDESEELGDESRSWAYVPSLSPFGAVGGTRRNSDVDTKDSMT